MARHVDLLGILYIVWGALNALLGIAMLALGFGAAALITVSGEEGAGLAAGITAVTFTVIAMLVLIWGGVQVWVGVALRQFRPWARLAALVFAILNLFALPFGTALGVYALWVLLNEQSRDLFERPSALPGPAS